MEPRFLLKTISKLLKEASHDLPLKIKKSSIIAASTQLDRSWLIVAGLVMTATVISLSEYRTFQRLSPISHETALTLGFVQPPSVSLNDFQPIVPSEPPLSHETEEGPEEDALTGLQRRTFRVDCGDTLSSILREIGIRLPVIDGVSRALSKYHNMKHLQIGQLIDLEWSVDKGQASLKSLETTDVAGNRICLSVTAEGGYSVAVQKRELETKIRHISGTITSTFEKAVRDQGVAASLAHEAARAMSPLVKLTQLRPHATFELIFEENHDKNTGKLVGKRCLKYISISTDKNKVYQVYGFRNQYYTEQGESLKAEFLRIPLQDQNPRVSSRFGMRRHPILGVVTRHYGVDYAAKYGSSIFAAARGVVVAAERRGAYGLYVRIRHANGYETAYGHMSSILVKKGQRVEQGDLIGKVGSSGRATGPHLHFELIRSKVRVDPQKYCHLGVTKLSGNSLNQFNEFKKVLNEQLSIKKV